MTATFRLPPPQKTHHACSQHIKNRSDEIQKSNKKLASNQQINQITNMKIRPIKSDSTPAIEKMRSNTKYSDGDRARFEKIYQAIICRKTITVNT